MPDTWTLDVDNDPNAPADERPQPGDRWCSLLRPGGRRCHPSIEGTADEWLAIATAIEQRQPHAFARVAFEPTSDGGGRLRSPRNAASQRDHAELTAAELAALVAHIREQLVLPKVAAPAAPAPGGRERPSGVPMLHWPPPSPPGVTQAMTPTAVDPRVAADLEAARLIEAAGERIAEQLAAHAKVADQQMRYQLAPASIARTFAGARMAWFTEPSALHRAEHVVDRLNSGAGCTVMWLGPNGGSERTPVAIVDLDSLTPEQRAAFATAPVADQPLMPPGRPATFDLDGNPNGPSCRCKPGKIDPECSHQADQDARDADVLVRVLLPGFLPALRAAIDRAAPRGSIEVENSTVPK